MILRKYRKGVKYHSVSMTFPLPDEEEDFYNAFNGYHYRRAIQDFLEESIRQRLKYQNLPADQDQLLEALRTELLEHVEDLHLM